jgi:hypothetical protein
MTTWARINIREIKGPWVKFPGLDHDQAEKLAMKMKADLIGWWDVQATYDISDIVPVEVG